MPQALFFLLLLACPVAMFFMMRGMHGGHGHAKAEEGEHQRSGHYGAGHDHEPAESSLDDLRSRRAELEREIAGRELAERSTAHAHH